MDFLDPQKQRAHRLRLLIGYVLTGLLLALATVVLLYEAYGFGIGENGQIIQNGLVFIGSEPSGANIFVNGVMKAQSTARLNIPAGQYTIAIQRDGYQTWQRSIGVEGGSVEHFVYPFLVPNVLKTTTIAQYNQPGALLQSPDQRWLIVPNNSTFGAFDEYDLAHPKNTATVLAMPVNALTAVTGAQSWQLVAWSNDNVHVLLRHVFAEGAQTASEYVLFNRADPSQTINLSRTLGTTPTNISLRDGAYDQYYLYNQTAQTLSTASLSAPTPTALAQHVLAYSVSDTNGGLLYVDGANTATGKVAVRLRLGSSGYTLGQLPVDGRYLLDIANYGGNWFTAFGVASDNKVAVYENPVAQLNANNGAALVPVTVLHVMNPNVLSFSPSQQLLMAESGNSFAVFDAKNAKTYAYTIKKPLDAPQTSAWWMDDFHLLYVSSGSVQLFDFDSANQRTLVAGYPGLLPAFDPQYHTLYTIAPQAHATGTATFALTSTSMLTPADQ